MRPLRFSLAVSLLATPAVADQRYEQLFSYDAGPRIIVIEPGTFDTAPRYRGPQEYREPHREPRAHRAIPERHVSAPVRDVMPKVPQYVAPPKSVALPKPIAAPVREAALPPLPPKKVRKVYPPEPVQAAAETNDPVLDHSDEGPPAYVEPDRRSIDQAKLKSEPRRTVLSQPYRGNDLTPIKPTPQFEQPQDADETTSSTTSRQAVTLSRQSDEPANIIEPNKLVPLTPVAPLD